MPMAAHRTVDRMPVPADHGLWFPVQVKPVLAQASGHGGAELVGEQAALKARAAEILRAFNVPVLIEERVGGRALHASLLGNAPTEVLPLLEVTSGNAEAFSDSGGEVAGRAGRGAWAPELRCPARGLEPALEERLRALALWSYRALGCRDYVRVDMWLDGDGAVYVQGVQPNLELTDGSAFMASARASGRGFGGTLAALIGLAAAAPGRWRSGRSRGRCWQRARAVELMLLRGEDGPPREWEGAGQGAR